MTNKNILLLVTQDQGGAGEGIYKIARLLISTGNNVAVLVKNKTKTDNFIIKYNYKKPKEYNLLLFIKNKIKKKYRKFFSKKNSNNEIILDENYYYFGTDESNINCNPKDIFKLIGFVPEFIFSGWTAGFLNSSDLLLLQQNSQAQVYNISVDMNHFTGGCHYAWDCNGYINGCTINCPAILSEKHKNQAKINFDLKLENAKSGDFKIISGSGWTLKQAQESKIYKNQKFFPNINSLIDTSIMKPTDKFYAKKQFGLENDKFYILMGCQNANEKRKGFEYLVQAINELYKNFSKIQREKIVVLIVSQNVVKNLDDINFNKKQLEFVTNYNDLAVLYSAADVFVNSSIEDSGPMMVSESLACGTPVVGFDMGVVNNLVISHYNGYKAKLMDAKDLAIGIKNIFELSPENYQKYSINGIETIKKYSSFETGIEVFNEILNSK